jgi:hypothetical protein
MHETQLVFVAQRVRNDHRRVLEMKSICSRARAARKARPQLDVTWAAGLHQTAIGQLDVLHDVCEYQDSLICSVGCPRLARGSLTFDATFKSPLYSSKRETPPGRAAGISQICCCAPVANVILPRTSRGHLSNLLLRAGSGKRDTPRGEPPASLKFVAARW